MKNYESPTIESAGGSGNRTPEQTFVLPLVLIELLLVVAVSWVVTYDIAWIYADPEVDIQR